MSYEAKTGDIFYDSWGYGQTNIDYYEVVGVTKSKKSVYVRPIKSTKEETGFMTGPATPVRGDFTGEKKLKRLYNYEGEPKLPSRFGSTSLWDGTPKMASWYN